MSLKKRILPAGLLISLALLWTSATQGMTISGTVKGEQGDGIAGAMVMARDLARGQVKTVFSNGQGQYQIPRLFPGKYEVKVKRIGFKIAEKKELEAKEAGLSKLDFVLSPTSDIADELPSTAWMALLPAGEMKRKFVLGCTGCHQFGEVSTRKARPKTEWIKTIQNMQKMGLGTLQVGYFLMPGIEENALAAWLVENGFGDKSAPPKMTPPPPVTGEAARAIITEYDVGEADSSLHDATVDKDGYGWAVDYLHDILYKVDPTSGIITKYEFPIKGGGPHTIHPDRNNFLWITLELADMVACFDPKTEKFRLYKGFTPGAFVHSFAIDSLGYIAYDSAGNLWVSEFFNNAVARLNPKTGEVKEYPLPLTGTFPKNSAGPYGITMDSQKNVWYTKLNEGVIGKVNSQTGEVKQYQMPTENSGPRRLCVDSQDRLWIPEFSNAKVARFDTKTESFKEYDLPNSSDYPYALRVDGAKDIVWIAGTGSDSLYRFDPETERFIQYPLPSQVAFVRQMAVDYKTGDLWTSYSNLPNGFGHYPKGVMVRIEFPE